MVGIRALIIICGMATRTGDRRIDVIPMVAGIAIDTRMCARERKNTVVIEGRWYPSRLRMAGFTIGRDLRSYMVGVGRLVIVGSMAARTGVRGVVIIAVVTNCTVIGNCTMRPV